MRVDICKKVWGEIGSFQIIPPKVRPRRINSIPPEADLRLRYLWNRPAAFAGTGGKGKIMVSRQGAKTQRCHWHVRLESCLRQVRLTVFNLMLKYHICLCKLLLGNPKF